MKHLREELMDLKSISTKEVNDEGPTDLSMPQPPKVPKLPDPQQQSTQEQDDGDKEDTASTTGFNNSFATVKTEIDLGPPTDFYRFHSNHGLSKDQFLQYVLSPNHSFQENEILRGHPPNVFGAYDYDEYGPPPGSSNNANNPENRYEEGPVLRRPDTPTVGYHHDPLFYHDNYDEVHSPDMEPYPPTSYIDYRFTDYNYGRSSPPPVTCEVGLENHHPPINSGYSSEMPETCQNNAPPQLPGEDCLADNIFGFLNSCIKQLNEAIACGPLQSTMTASLIPLEEARKGLQEAKRTFDDDFVNNGHDNHCKSFCSLADGSGLNDEGGNGHGMENGNE